MENVKFKQTCFVFDEKIQVVVSFPSEKYYINHVIACVVNAILAIATACLNTLTIVVYWKSSKLKEKVSYFLIMVLSFSDLAVGMICNSLFTFVLASEIAGTATCESYFATKKTNMMLAGFSITTLSAINIERYLGIVHPMFHRLKVTKTRVFMYVIFNIFLWITMLCLFIDEEARLRTFVTVNINFFFVLTIYIYMRIFHASRLSRRAVCPENPPNRSNTIPPRNIPDLRGRQRFLQDVKLAKSCFLMVICFFICLLPVTVVPTLSIDGFLDVVFITWSSTLALMNSSLNSIVLFWKSRMLRNEARGILKQVFCR